MSRGRSTGTRITNPDLKAYAESFGIRAHRPSTVEELSATLVDAIQSRELRLIEIPIDASVNRELHQKLERYWNGR